MKNIFFTLMIFASLDSAFADPCAEGSAFKGLSLNNGKRDVGNCRVEVHVCEKRNSAAALPYHLSAPLEENGQYWVGDVYVKQAGGKSLYIPLFASESRFPNTTVSMADLSKMYHYKYVDKNYDQVSGRKEQYEIKFYKRRQKIEVSMSSSRESRRNPIRSLFFPDVKINCEK